MHQPPNIPISSQPPLYTWRIALTSTFIMCMVGGITLSVKEVSLFGFDLPGGVFLFPFTYSIIVVIAEVYGFAVAERTVYIGLALLAIYAACFEIVLNLPSSAIWHHQAAFLAVYGVAPRDVLIGIAAYSIGQIVTVFLYRLVYRRSRGRLLTLRLFGVPCGAQIITGLFAVPLSLYGLYNGQTLFDLLIYRIQIDVAQSVIAAPLIWATIITIRRFEIKNARVMMAHLEEWRMAIRQMDEEMKRRNK